MESPSEPSPRGPNIDFWQQRYVTGETPWDLGEAPPALQRWLANPGSAPGRVLIPGCGRGHEVKAFHDAGWDVLAIDYAPAAVARARSNLGPLADRVMLADFFEHDFGERLFDVIYERTFLCANPPSHWPAYVQRMRALLEENGRLVGLFLFGQEDDPPPYPLAHEAQERALFRDAFFLRVNEAVPDSPPRFAGCERWQVWARA